MGPVDLDLGLAGTHVLVTGGAGMIGSRVVSAFLSAGARVSVLDVSEAKMRALKESVGADAARGLYAEGRTEGPRPKGGSSSEEAPSGTEPRAAAEHSSVRLWCGQADVSDEAQLARSWAMAESVSGPVACCVALASLDLSVLQHHAGGIAELELEQWERTLRVNVTGTFLTARQWVRQLKRCQEASTASKASAARTAGVTGGAGTAGGAREPKESTTTTTTTVVMGDDRKDDAKAKPELANRSLIIVGSESGLFGERANPDYAAGKSAVQGGLLASLKADVPRTLGGRARVNAVAPGPVDTEQFRRECGADPGQYYADARATVALGRPVDVDAVARAVVFLASERWSGNVHGQVLRVDSGKEGKLMWREEE